MTKLLDANVMIALGVTSHDHHALAGTWLLSQSGKVASSPITQGALLRHLLRAGLTYGDAFEILDSIIGDPRHEFWHDDIPFDRSSLRGLVGHRQVTDAYLASLAAAHRGTLATFDVGLAALRPDVVELIPT